MKKSIGSIIGIDFGISIGKSNTFFSMKVLVISNELKYWR